MNVNLITECCECKTSWDHGQLDILTQAGTLFTYVCNHCETKNQVTIYIDLRYIAVPLAEGEKQVQLNYLH